MPRVHDTVLLSGWLFADLLLALAVLFLVANTTGINIAPARPPTLLVTPVSLNANANTQYCTGGTTAPQCTVTIMETSSSDGEITWQVSNDFSNSVKYSASTGTLLPGQRFAITISAIACQNGSFTFTGQRISDKVNVTPVVVAWRCVPPPTQPERLESTPNNFPLTINDVNAFLTGNSQDDDIRQQIENTPVLRGESVGLAIAYDGAPDDNAIGQSRQVSLKILSLLPSLSQQGFHVFDRSSYYGGPDNQGLFTLGPAQSDVRVDVYFFIH